jgi:hypothetical protein
MSRTRVLGCLLFAGLMIGLGGSAQAQTYCFREASGVPFQGGQPVSMTDPRWNGSFGLVQGESKVEFRALTLTERYERFLVMGFRVQGDFNGNSPLDIDTVTLQFVDDVRIPAVPTGTLIKIHRLANTAASSCRLADGDFAVEVSKYVGTPETGNWTLVASKGMGGSTDMGSMPDWLMCGMKGELLCDMSTLPATCSRWSLVLKIPLSQLASPDDLATGINLPSKFRFAYQVDLQHEWGGSPVVEPPVVWPSSAEIGWSTLPPSYPAPAQLAYAQIQGGPDPCATGISISAGQVTVEHGTPPVVSTQIALNSANTFRARPWNGLAIPIAEGALQAVFRIADWGAALGRSPAWREICVGGSAGTGTVPAGSQFDLSCAWSLTQEEKCHYGRSSFPATTCAPFPNTPTTPDHSSYQSVLAELRPVPTSATGPGVTLPAGAFFANMSAYRNMAFVNASRFSRPVQIERFEEGPAAGKKARRAQSHDVIAFVETIGMSEVAPATPKRGKRELSRLGMAPMPNKWVQISRRLRDQKLIGQLHAAGAAEGKIGARVADLLKEQYRLGRVTHDEISAVLPTYMVHVWYDTGRKVKLKGKQVSLLAPAPGFGYYVSHDGPLVGWKFGIKGAGVKSIGPNLYRITPPAKGALAAETWLAACEDEKCAD